MIRTKQDGEDHVWEILDRAFGGATTEAFRIKNTGDVFIGGVKANGAAGVLVANKTIANAAVRTLHGTPVQVIPKPPAGKYVEIVSMHAKLVYATAAFDSVAATDFLELRYTDGSGALLTATVSPVGFGDATADAHVTITPAVSGWIPANAPVMAYVAGTEWYASAGGGALHLEVLYRLRDLGI